MNGRVFARSFAALRLEGAYLPGSRQPTAAAQSDVLRVSTFSYAGKELRPFLDEAQTTLTEQESAGYLDHLWCRW